MSRNFHKPPVSVIGGDNRSVILAELLQADGYDVVCSAIGTDGEEFKKALNRRCVVLPLPVSRDGVSLNAPMNGGAVMLVDIIQNIHPHTRVFCGGLSESLKSDIESTGAKAFDYYNTEYVLSRNAYLTAEGALKILLEATEKSLVSSKILIIGCGRCGKALAVLLRKIGCDVTLASRSKKNRAFAVLNRLKLKKTADIRRYIGEFDIVVNTAPALVLDAGTLSELNSDAFVLELASATSGVDIAAAKQLGLNAVYAPGLPGKYSPEEAARILCDSITQIISEEFA